MSEILTASEDASQTLRGVLISVGPARLLLPNANVSEVITFSDPEPVEAAPPWLLGRVRWQGWRLPLVSFPEMVGLPAERAKLGAKVAVLKLLGGDPTRSYFALLSQGFPRLITVRPEALEQPAPEFEGTPGIRHAIRIDGDLVFVPDLAAVEAALVEALPQAA